MDGVPLAINVVNSISIVFLASCPAKFSNQTFWWPTNYSIVVMSKLHCNLWLPNLDAQHHCQEGCYTELIFISCFLLAEQTIEKNMDDVSGNVLSVVERNIFSGGKKNSNQMLKWSLSHCCNYKSYTNSCTMIMSKMFWQ